MSRNPPPGDRGGRRGSMGWRCGLCGLLAVWSGLMGSQAVRKPTFHESKQRISLVCHRRIEFLLKNSGCRKEQGKSKALESFKEV